MIIDTSAVMAILLKEPERDRLLIAVRQRGARISAGSFVELGVVLDARGIADEVPELEPLLSRLGIVVEPIRTEQARIAREAHRRYGRGSGHRARLNFGDTFAYALAKERGEPLLCKGGHFLHTDVAIAAY